MGIYNPYVIPFPLLLSNTVLGRTRLKKTQLKRGGDSIPKTRDLLDVALLMNGLAVFIGAQINPQIYRAVAKYAGYF